MPLKLDAKRIALLREHGAALPIDEPPLGIGDRCHMNGGHSLDLLVVDIDGDLLTVAFAARPMYVGRGRADGGVAPPRPPDQALELFVPRDCVRRNYRPMIAGSTT